MALAPTLQLQAAHIQSGVYQLDLGVEPAFGKVCMFAELLSVDGNVAAVRVGLAGIVTSGLLKYYGDALEGKEGAAVFAGIKSATSALNIDGGIRVDHIELPHEFGMARDKVCRIGGASAYFDGKGKFYVEDWSASFGPITEKALRLCLDGKAPWNVIAGDSIVKGSVEVSPKGLERLARVSQPCP